MGFEVYVAASEKSRIHPRHREQMDERVASVENGVDCAEGEPGQLGVGSSSTKLLDIILRATQRANTDPSYYV